jgi:hypothetical protein
MTITRYRRAGEGKPLLGKWEVQEAGAAASRKPARTPALWRHQHRELWSTTLVGVLVCIAGILPEARAASGSLETRSASRGGVYWMQGAHGMAKQSCIVTVVSRDNSRAKHNPNRSERAGRTTH